MTTLERFDLADVYCVLGVSHLDTDGVASLTKDFIGSCVIGEERRLAGANSDVDPTKQQNWLDRCWKRWRMYWETFR